MRNSFIILLISTLLLASCIDIPQYDLTPSIAFNSLTKYTVQDYQSKQDKDSIVLTIDFTDGDGDLGVGQIQYSDWGNYKIRTFMVRPDKSEVELALTEDKFAYFPVLKPDGKPGPIKGKLDFGFTTFHFQKDPRNTPITLKFRVKIRDRALRESQEIETDTISTPLSKDYLYL